MFWSSMAPTGSFANPIYSGFLLATLGTALAFRQLRWFLVMALGFLILFLQARVEDRFIEEQFGAKFSDYRNKVKSLIPFIS